MGAIRVLKSDDGKPYISLEDFIIELETLRDTLSLNDDNPPPLLPIHFLPFVSIAIALTSFEGKPEFDLL